MALVLGESPQTIFCLNTDYIVWTLYRRKRLWVDADTRISVGVGGHSLHGGYGFSSHTHGMALDWIAGASVVLANGSLVECSATENEDLYWALRGAGSSFGIVTEFRFNTFVAPQYVVPFSLRPNIRTSTDLAQALSAFQNYTLEGMPAEMNLRFQIAAYSTEFEGLYHGTNASMVAALQPLLTMLNITNFRGAKAVDWMTGFDDYAYSGQIDITSSTYSAVSFLHCPPICCASLPGPC
jgi:FAD/FMN-containing dehydrogenase